MRKVNIFLKLNIHEQIYNYNYITIIYTTECDASKESITPNKSHKINLPTSLNRFCCTLRNSAGAFALCLWLLVLLLLDFAAVLEDLGSLL